MRVLVLGAGFGGLELTTRLSDELGDDVDVVLIDRADGFVFGFSKLDVMFGRTTADAVFHAYADIVKPGVRFVQTEVRSIDAAAKEVETDAGTFEADILVVALGADVDPTATPGLVEGGNEFYTVDGAFGLRDVLADFAGGRVIVGVTSTPFKCPPAPSETALLMDEHLRKLGVREQSEVALVMPLPVPIPPSPAASAALLEAFAERGIDWVPGTLVRALDPERKVAIVGDGTEMPYDLFLGIPKHQVPAGRRGVRALRRRLDPGRSAHAGDRGARRVRRRRRHQRRHAEGGRVRRGSGGRGGRRDRCPSPRCRRDRDLRRARCLLPRVRRRRGRGASRSPSSPVPRRSARSTARRRRSPTTRRSSAPVASAAGSRATGRTSDRQSPPLATAAFASANCRRSVSMLNGRSTRSSGPH